MTAGRIALLWIVLVAAWPVLNLNDPLRQVSRYVSVLLQRATWELPETVPDGNVIQMGQTKDVLARFRELGITEDGEQPDRAVSYTFAKPRTLPFPAREVAWFSFAVFTIGMTWKHYRGVPRARARRRRSGRSRPKKRMR